MDVDVNVIDAIEHAFHLYDGLVQEVNPDNSNVGEGQGEDDDLCSEGKPEGESTVEDFDIGLPGEATSNGQDFEANLPDPTKDLCSAVLEDTTTTPLFAGAQLLSLMTTLLTLNCLKVHGASNALIFELFMLLSKSVLSSVNSLPSSEYMALKMLCQLGLAYDLIHACQDGACYSEGQGRIMS